MQAPQADAVSLDDLAGLAARASGPPPARAASPRLVLALFVSFLLVVSDFFTGAVLTPLGSRAVRGRSPTPFGVVVQGVALVLLYIAAIYLTENGVL